MSSHEIRSLLFFGALALMFILVARAGTNLWHRRYCRCFKKHCDGGYPFDLYIAIEYFFIDVAIQSVFFLLLRWYVALICWAVSLVPMWLIAKKPAVLHHLFNRAYQKKAEKLAPLIHAMQTEEDTSRTTSFSSSVFGPRIKNTLHHINWFEGHLCCLALLLIPVLCDLMPWVNYAAPTGTVAQTILDYITMLSFLAVIYVIGLFAFAIPIRVENWRRIWYFVFGLIALGFFVLGIVIKCLQ